MAGGFSFPPPPPPPPKPTAQTQQKEFEYSQQSGRGGRGRGGFEPRGRGSGRGRGGGRGNPNFEATGPNQHSNYNQESNFSQPQGARGGSSQWQNSYHGSRSVSSSNSQPPPGSFINPNFVGQRQSTNANPAYQQNPTAVHSSSNEGHGRSQVGHKRKLDALRGPQPPREKKPAPQTAPAVPSFGAPILPSAPPSAPSRPNNNSKATQVGDQPKATPKTLGLTPQDGAAPSYPSDSEDEDIDEEAQFAELGTKLTFEHNGEVMTLNNEADLAAWKEERRKQFPTRGKVSQKEGERLRVGEERKRLLAAVAKLHLAPRNRDVQVKTRSLREPARTKENDTRQTEVGTSMTQQIEQKPEDTASVGKLVEELPEEPEVAQRAVPDASHDMINIQHDATVSDAGNTAASVEAPSVQNEDGVPKGLPGIDMGETDDESGVEADGATAGAEIEAEASSNSDSDDDDGPPEQVSSKPRPSAPSDAQRPVCRYFSASGRCRDGDTCRFRHELSSKAPSARPFQAQQDKPAFDRYAAKLDPKTEGRKSIFERLVEQEQQGDDRLALQVIKALGQAGVFCQPETDVEG